MRNLFMFAAVAVVTMLASCSEDQEGVSLKKETVLSVKISSTDFGRTKGSVTAPVGLDYKTDIDNGVIFVCDYADNVERTVAINPSTIRSAEGQDIGKVSIDTKVFVVANVDEGKVTDWTTSGNFPSSISKLKLEAFDIQGSTISGATLANSSGEGAPIVLGSGTGGGNGANQGQASVNITIAPVFSRLEVLKVTAKPGCGIEGFTVAGIYIDKYYPQYTLAGSFAGTQYNQNQELITGTYPGLMDMWIENARVANNNVAEASDDLTANVWGFNLPSGDVPRIIVKLIDVTGNKGDNPIPDGTYYLTVKGFRDSSSGMVSAFTKGKVYRLGITGAAVGAEGILFDENDLSTKPNAEDVDLWATVDVAAWVLDEIGGEL